MEFLIIGGAIALIAGLAKKTEKEGVKLPEETFRGSNVVRKTSLKRPIMPRAIKKPITPDPYIYRKDYLVGTCEDVNKIVTQPYKSVAYADKKVVIDEVQKKEAYYFER